MFMPGKTNGFHAFGILDTNAMLNINPLALALSDTLHLHMCSCSLNWSLWVHKYYLLMQMKERGIFKGSE